MAFRPHSNCYEAFIWGLCYEMSGIMQPLFFAFFSAMVLAACTLLFSNIIYFNRISLLCRCLARSCKIGLLGADET